MELPNVLGERVPAYLFDPRLDECIVESIEHIRGDLERFAPSSAAAMNGWIDGRTAHAEAAECFRGLKAHFLLIPWFLETRICGDVDRSFQRDLIYSSINAYYFVRLLDNVADGHSPGDKTLLPMAALFHAKFQSAYCSWFPPDSPFWEYFNRLWIGMADATIRSAAVGELVESDFVSVSSQKIAAVKIPVTAVCFRYGRSDLLGPWVDFYDRFACSHEMLDDLGDWHVDLMAGRATFLLSEAGRHKRTGESVHAYLIREGLAAGYAKILEWLNETKELARGLDSPMLCRFVEYRHDLVERFWCTLAPSLDRLNHLAEVLEAPLNG